MSEENIETLALRISDFVQEAWQVDAQPVLLSNLGMELRRSGVDYKPIISGKSLSAFISEQVDQVTIIQHPTEKLKLGVIPKGEFFEFQAEASGKKDPSEVESGSNSTQPENTHVTESRRALYAFIHQLSKLPASERDGVNIPINVLIRLMEGK